MKAKQDKIFNPRGNMNSIGGSTEVMFRQGQPAAYALPYGYHPGTWNTVIQPTWWNQADNGLGETSDNLANTSTSTTSTSSPPPMEDHHAKLMTHEDLYANAHVYGMTNAHVHAPHIQYPHQQSIQVIKLKIEIEKRSSNDDRFISKRFLF